MGASRIQMPSAGISLASPRARGDVLVAEGGSLAWASQVRGLSIRRVGGRVVQNAVTGGYTEALGFNIQQYGMDVSTVITNAAAVTSPDGSQFCRATHATSGNIGLSHFGAANVTARIYPYFGIYGRVEDNVDGCTGIGFSTAVPLNTVAQNNNSALFRCRNGSESTWRAVTRDTANGETDTGISLDTNWHLWEVFTNDGGVTWKFWIDGIERASRTTNVPSTSTGMGWGFMNIPITNTPRTLSWTDALCLVGNPADSLAFASQEADGAI